MKSAVDCTFNKKQKKSYFGQSKVLSIDYLVDLHKIRTQIFPTKDNAQLNSAILVVKEV